VGQCKYKFVIQFLIKQDTYLTNHDQIEYLVTLYTEYVYQQNILPTARSRFKENYGTVLELYIMNGFDVRFMCTL